MQRAIRMARASSLVSSLEAIPGRCFAATVGRPKPEQSTPRDGIAPMLVR